MNKKISLGAAVTFMVVIAGITFCITMMVALSHFNKMVHNVNEREAMYNKLSNIDNEVRQNYAGVENIDEEYLNNLIAAGYIRGIGDPYASYYTKAEYEAMLQEEKGELVSIGIETYQDQTGYLGVLSVEAGSAAEQNGIQRGDLIISVDGTDLKTLSYAQAVQLLKGKIGTKCTVVYRRDGVDTTKELQRVALAPAYVNSRVIGDIGYVQIRAFNSQAVAQFKTAVEKVMKSNITGIIFDVRGNNSMSIDAANEMLNVLLPSHDLGYIVGKSGDIELSGTSDSYYINLPMTVLVDSGTGCAAEYFAAVMRETSETKLIGSQTMGKSAIQELRPLTDGSAISITVSHFLTSAQLDIEGVGLKADYEISFSAEQMQNPASVTDQTDPHIHKALEVLHSKTEENTQPTESSEESASSDESASDESAAVESSEEASQAAE